MKEMKMKVFSGEKPGRRKSRRMLPVIYLLILGSLVWAAMYGKRIGITGMLFLLGLQIVLWIYTHNGGGYCVFFISITALLFVMYRPAGLYDAVYGAEGYVARTFRLLTGQTDGQTGGGISRGNNHRIGVSQLELAVSEKPAEMLYLKNFTGGIYSGNRWEAADDDTLVREVAQELGWRNWIEMARGMYHSSSFILNQYTERENPPPVRDLYVRRKDVSPGIFCAPYYGRESWNKKSAGDMWESGYRNQYQYYEQKDMDIRWEDLDDQMGDSREWYRSILDAYRIAAQEVYTQVPEGIVPQLEQFVEEHPQEGLDAITAFITDTLRERASYTLTPGWAPVNVDIVDYFLFESGQGYCQHFASAAVLMYQMYGIPARYASGYVLRPEDFTEGSRGMWEAEVTDESAHAWAEIYLEDYGWTPVEVTPSADGVIRTTYPDYEYVPSGQTGEGFSVYLDLEKYGEIYRSIGIFLAGIFASVLLFLYDRRQQYQEQLRNMGCRKAFSIIIEMLHCEGYFLEMNGAEADFPEKVSGEFSQVTTEEMERLQEIVREAAYGKEMPKAEDEAFVREIYFRLKNACSQGGLWQRFLKRGK